MTTNPARPPPPPIDYESDRHMMVDRDTEHLRILSICWFVDSGLAVVTHRRGKAGWTSLLIQATARAIASRIAASANQGHV